MAILEARHKSDDSKQWARELPPGQEVRLGSIAATCDWPVEWDHQISKSMHHATLLWQDGQLLVRRRLLPRPTLNPIWFNGVQRDEFHAAPGDKFVIGETVFKVVEERKTLRGSDVVEFTIGHEQLQQVRFVDPDQRIDALSELALIRDTTSDAELQERVARALLRGVPRADAAALIQMAAAAGQEPRPVVRCRIPARGRPAEAAPPPAKLVDRAIRSREPVLYLLGEVESHQTLATEMGEVDWAICVPLRNEACAGWAVYLSGRLPRELEPTADASLRAELQSDLKFAELVAQVYGAIRQARELEDRVAWMGRFFNRNVLRYMSDKDLKLLLQARPTPVTVLFCDIRGSCAIAEQGAGDLPQLWATVSEALEVMTKAILDNQGVVGDFQGDAAMGFWGWPPSIADASRPVSESALSESAFGADQAVRQVERAAQAALQIRRTFAQHREKPGSPLAGFACGIGIAHGVAMAGRIGSIEQFKVGVFGPVVNLAARLESMTKLFRVSVLADGAAAALLARAGARHRHVARVVPAGLATPVDVHELLLPVADAFNDLKEPDRQDYEVGLDHFTRGKWDRVGRKLIPGDGPSEFLRRFMADHANTPPPGWDGTIRLEAK